MHISRFYVLRQRAWRRLNNANSETVFEENLLGIAFRNIKKEVMAARARARFAFLWGKNDTRVFMGPRLVSRGRNQ